MNATTRPAWQTSLDLESQAEDHYLDYFNEPLLELLAAPPRQVLDLGCSGGKFGAVLKERFPGARVVGVEAAPAAAAKAETRLDRVLRDRLEALDLAAAGYAAGAFDVVVASDVLEHLVNPWKLLVDLRRFMAADGVLITSIPNVRNIGLISDLLLNGRWQYAERGLLDVTHLRFFTLAGMHEMFAETGWRVEHYNVNIMPDLAPLWEQSKARQPINIRGGRLTLENLTRQELDELCAQQFFLRCRPVAA
jgi:trans-aconitate methyltransferase